MQLFKKESIPVLAVVILLAAVVVLSIQWYIAGKSLTIAENTVKTYHYNQSMLNFTKLFVAKVLKADGEVSFDDRLNLENSVRAINDKAVFDQWNKFVNAKTALEAQIEVKNLLEMLINKISL